LKSKINVIQARTFEFSSSVYNHISLNRLDEGFSPIRGVAVDLFKRHTDFLVGVVIHSTPRDFVRTPAVYINVWINIVCQ